jgi:Carboxypeptidase regulatory-like domain/TonB dependent receptor
MRRLFVALVVLFSWVCMTGSIWAQVQIAAGSIRGTILDEKGGTVPDAGVEAKNIDTNLSKTVASDSEGRFEFTSLPPGTYTVTISKAGFATMVQTGATLTVGQVMSLPVTMKVSAAQEKIEVSATPEFMDTVSTASSTTLNEVAVSETPILGRKFEDLLTLTPGVSIVQGPDGDEINFNGQRGVFNNISLDGGDYNNGFFGEQMGGQRAAIDITLDAVKEFQVVASGANAEFGRTAGGVVNVITKSGTNDLHGSAFYYQRLEALASATSDGKPLDGFKREQIGMTLGGPIVKDKLFFFGSGEGVLEDLNRSNLSSTLGTPCAIANPVFRSNITDAQINASGDCQRQVLLAFMKTNFNENDGLPVSHQVRNAAAFGRMDYNFNASNQISASYNFDWSKNPNQTFDVPTYGTTANGIEGPSKIQAFNTNWFSTVSPSMLNEAHFTYSRENRPRLAVDPSSVPDTGIGFAPSFRFGQPFFLEPGVDEVFWRTDIRDDFSITHGAHTLKFGGEYLHSLNSQIFRGFHEGRFIFGDVAGFLHYASPASLGAGFGPTTVECSNGTFSSTTVGCGAAINFGSPLFLYLQDGPTKAGETLDQAGASTIANEEFALFIQDTWKVTHKLTLNYGLRWEAQHFPSPTTPPAQTPFGQYLSNPAFPSTGFLPNQNKMFQPRIGFAWDIRGNGKSALRASWGIFNARQNMLTQVGAITTNGVQQQTITGVFPTYPNTIPVTFPPTAAPSVTVFSKNYANPRIYAVNVAYEQQIRESMSAYADFDWSMGVHLTRFEDPNSALSGFSIPAALNSDTVNYTGAASFPNLGSITNTTSDARSLYRGVTFGVREHISNKFQMEANYTYSQDWDDDSNERDPFTFRYANFYNLKAEYAPSDRDERHRFNFYTFAKLPFGFNGDIRMQAHSAQPITDNVNGTGTGPACSLNNSLTRFVNGVDCGRNHLRKDNQYFSFDLALDRTFHLGERVTLAPKLEIFNLFNNANNVNPLSSPALFDFNGFLRVGVGDPRQAQLSVRLEF